MAEFRAVAQTILNPTTTFTKTVDRDMVVVRPAG
jgi:hypothetical protein